MRNATAGGAGAHLRLRLRRLCVWLAGLLISNAAAVGYTADVDLVLPSDSPPSAGEVEAEAYVRRTPPERFGAEELRAHDDLPHIPEPMVFDLVRPLGARRGEFEFNTLLLAPLNRRVGLANEIPDSIGLTQERGERHRAEWAPEFEYAIRDGLAIEFELPFEEARLAAYKTAVQWTLGTAFDHKLIHGLQAIALYDTHSKHWSPTVSYVVGVRFDEVWSTLVMMGLRSEINGDDVAERTERLFNWSLFADVGPHTTVGLETNFAESLRGPSAWLVMPQWHWEVRDHWMIQAGAGARFTQSYTLPECGLRLIRTF